MTEYEAIQAFKAFSSSHGIILPDTIKADGIVHRFPVGDKPGNKDGAYVLHVDGSPNGWVKDWRSEKHEWRSGQSSMSSYNRHVREQETSDKQAEAALGAEKIYSGGKSPSPSESHPYLAKKGLASFHNAKISQDGRLVIPLINSDDIITSVQYIDGKGTKHLLKGGKKQGSFSILNNLPDDEIQTIVIGEGFATVASILEDDYCSGTGNTAGSVLGVMAIDAGNLKPVAIAFRDKYPGKKIVIAGDIGDSGNKGENAARDAAAAIGAYVAFPSLEIGDFNDYLTQPKGNQSKTLAQIIDGAIFIEKEEHQEEIVDNSWRTRLNAHVENFNKEFAQTLIGGKHRIMREDSHTGEISFFSQLDFERMYQHRFIQVGTKADGKPKFDTLAKSWLSNYHCRTYNRGVIFDPALPPGDCGNEQFNQWRGFAITLKENHDITAAIRFHIENVVCAGDQSLIDYFYNWIAYTFQHPEKPAGSALVLRGEKGSGKGTIGNFLKNLWGNHSLHITSPKHLTGNFNAHLANVCFLFADEAFYSNDKQGEGVLKALITEPHLMIERKGLDAEQQPNRLKIFMATNSDYAVPASRDERRYCVFDVSSERIGDRDYFDALQKDCGNRDVQAAFLYSMLKRDISRFHPGCIPESIGLQDQRLNSLNTIGKWLVDSFGQGFFSMPENHLDGSTVEVLGWIPATRLYWSYIHWCDNAKADQYKRESQTMFGRYLDKVGYEKRHSNGVRRCFYTLQEAIEKLEQYEKISIDGKAATAKTTILANVA